MELKQAIEQRRSIRKFKPGPVADEHIKEILKAARLAPSGTNLQPWRFVVVKDKEVRQQMEPHTLNFVTQAPVVLVCCVDLSTFGARANKVAELKEAGAFIGTNIESFNNTESVKERFSNEDVIKSYLGLNAAIAIDHMTLRAVDLGLGSCWVMMFKQKEIKELLGLGDEIQIVALLPIGYPDQDPKPRPRIDLEKLIIKEV